MITLHSFEGRWHLSRVIEDNRAGLTGRLEGTCAWRPDGDGLRQEESGLLHYGDGPPMQASRVYLWRDSPAGVQVLFEDGRPFHRFDPDTGTDRHYCDPDIYDVTYDLSAWPIWTQSWHVIGPRKDALITSRFSPDPDRGA